MLVPRILFGQRGEVKRRVAPLVRAFADGRSAQDLDFGPLMRSAEAPGALFPLNPGPGAAGRADFHCYAFMYGVMEAQTAGKVDRKRFEDAFGWSLEQPWSFLGTLSQVGGLFFLKMDRAAFIKEPAPEALRGRPEWYLPFLSAASRHWQALAVEGSRFPYEPLSSPREFTRSGRPILQVLGELGFSDVDTSAKVERAIQQALAQQN